MFIDQPVGVGFSHGSTTVGTSSAAASDVWKVCFLFNSNFRDRIARLTMISLSLVPSNIPLRGGKEGFVLDGGRYARLIAYVSACFAAAAVIAVVGWAHDRMLTLRSQSSE